MLVPDQLNGASRSISLACTPEPVVVTSTLPAASKLSRSPTFSTAFLAVGAHTPFEQLIFCVAADEMVTSASAPDAARAAGIDRAAKTIERACTKSPSVGWHIIRDGSNRNWRRGEFPGAGPIGPQQDDSYPLRASSVGT